MPPGRLLKSMSHIISLESLSANFLDRHDAAQKRKRQERDVLLQQQAKHRKAVKKAEILSEPTVAQEAAEKAAEREQAHEGFRTRKSEIPDLLPPEFLDSDDEDEAAAAPRTTQTDRPKRIKFEELEEQSALEFKPPRDERIGSTVYRVLASKGDARLAPRKSKASHSMKQHLLVRKKTVQRKTGFLV